MCVNSQYQYIKIWYINTLVNSAKNEVKGLSKKDLVICGGPNDIGRNNSAMALAWTLLLTLILF
jgi:hypothetical protein